MQSSECAASGPMVQEHSYIIGMYCIVPCTDVITQNGKQRRFLSSNARFPMNGSEEIGYVCVSKHLFWLDFLWCTLYLLWLWDIYVCTSLSLFLSPASYKRRSKQKEQGKKKKQREIFPNEPNHEVPSPLPTHATFTTAHNIPSLGFNPHPLSVVVGRFSSPRSNRQSSPQPTSRLRR